MQRAHNVGIQTPSALIHFHLFLRIAPIVHPISNHSAIDWH